jgi:hypothetical protein
LDDAVSYIRDEDVPRLDPQGETAWFRRVTFKIGKDGPYTETIPKDTNFDSELRRRIDALKQSIANRPR